MPIKTTDVNLTVALDEKSNNDKKSVRFIANLHILPKYFTDLNLIDRTKDANP